MAITEAPSPNIDERPTPVDMLILHYTGMQSAEAAIARLRDPEARVSSHYVVDEAGEVFRLVPEHLRAWHAGISYWRGRRVLNDGSIGIEIVNPGHEWGYRPFPDVQMKAVSALCLDILGRHAIPARNVIGHSDVAPNRKQDPGELFPWQALASSGIGLWPDGASAEGDLARSLSEIGYEAEPTGSVTLDIITAFQRHWHPERVGLAPDQETLRRAARLAAMMRSA